MVPNMEALFEVRLREVLTRTHQLLEEAQVKNGWIPEMIADAGNRGFHCGWRLGHMAGELAKLEEYAPLRSQVSVLYQKVVDS